MKLQYEQSEYVECYKGLNKNRQQQHLSKVINVNIRALRQQKYKNCKLALNKGKIEALPKIVLFIYVFYFMFISIIKFYDEMLYSLLFYDLHVYNTSSFSRPDTVSFNIIPAR